jgi:tetratricopeptide (TPR) repeat protein
VLSAALFGALWAILRGSGDAEPWLPSGLAAGVVLVVAIAARHIALRHALSHYLLEAGRGGEPVGLMGRTRASLAGPYPIGALRALEQRLAKIESGSASPATHWEAYRLCQEYLERAEDALRATSAGHRSHAIVRASQERVRALQKHHMMSWARQTSRALADRAQRNGRASDQLKAAADALNVIETALRVYPEEPELNESAAAVRDLISAMRIKRWVERAERAAFKGQYERAIDRYRDALFYLSREDLSENARGAVAEQINREIQALESCLAKSGPAHASGGLRENTDDTLRSSISRRADQRVAADCQERE